MDMKTYERLDKLLVNILEKLDLKLDAKENEIKDTVWEVRKLIWDFRTEITKLVKI